MKILVATLFCCLFLQSHAQLTTSKLFGDHMVLQRNQDIPIWGKAGKNVKIKLNINGQEYNTKTDETGGWKIILKPIQAGGPYVMNISSGKENLVYNDVMIGEVWICSGQSNMELVLKNALGYKFEQKNSPGEAIRQFRVPDKISLQPEKELSGGQWVKADTGTVGDFTAVGYYFAKQLATQLHVTVGLINSSWGGTQIEDWISKDAMLNSPELGAAAKLLPDTWDGVKQRVDKQLRNYAYGKKPVVDYAENELAAEPASFFDDWQKGSAPGQWQWTGKLYSYNGQGYMQRTIKLDSVYTKRNAILSLGQTDADLDIYINGKLIQKGAFLGNYQLNLPVGTWKPGSNSFLIDLKSGQKNPSWYGLGISGLATDLYVRFADTTINLADNNWRVMPDLSKPYHFDYLPNNTANMLYNSMVNPLINYAIAGVIWYQGESNSDVAFQYRSTFPLLINDWRSRWKRDFPFLFVQLASFGGMQNSNYGSNWAELREAQTMALQLPNTGMAVTTDISEAINIHPRNKADVGLRLADKALTMVYHLTGFSESPLFKSADFSGGYAVVSLRNAGNGLFAKDQYGYIRGFELAGADHKFYYAQAAIIDGGKVKVWGSQVLQPIAVRYAWTDAPVDANLYNTEGFPVSPFRSDDWKGITADRKFE